jgi:hypothetical protein
MQSLWLLQRPGTPQVPQTKEEDPVSKVYLGDGVYVDANQAGQIVLTTEDGIGVTNIIYLEPEVCETLKAYIDQAQWQKSSAPNVGDVVEVFLNGNWVLQTVKEVGSHPPYVDCIMVKGLYRWFTCGEYRAPGISIKTFEDCDTLQVENFIRRAALAAARNPNRQK